MPANPINKIVPGGEVGKWIKFGIYAVIIIIVIVIIIKIYKALNAPPKPNYANLTPDAGNTPNFDPTGYTNAVYEDLDAGRLSPHSSAPYTALLKLSNTQLEMVYNDWLNRYDSSFDNQTLTQAIAASWSIWNFSFNTDANQVVARLQTLNLA